MEEESSNNIPSVHKSVLTNEILKNLNLSNGSVVIDATANGGGHSIAILGAIKPKGRLLSIEWDGEMLDYLNSRLENENIHEGIKVVQGNFKNIEFIANDTGFSGADAILFDLGMSSFHVDVSKRGFTFRYNEPLDMRYSNESRMTASDIVNTFKRRYLEEIIRTYGEEKYAEQIADAIVSAREKGKIVTTFDLVAVIEKSVPSFYRKRRIHCATKTFQALRIFVNDELENIRVALERAYKTLKAGGRMGAISFHSLEDKIVKNFGKEKESLGVIKIITKKSLATSFHEKKENRRARSAKLRIFEKIK